MPPANLRSWLIVAALAAALTFPAGGRAQVNFYWNGQGQPAGVNTTPPAAGGTGTWDGTTLNWVTPDPNTGASSAWVNGSNANFAGTAGTVTLAAGFTAAAINFSTTGYVLTNSASANTVTASSVTAGHGTVGAFGVNTSTNSVLVGNNLTISGGGEAILAAALGTGTTGGVTVSGGSTLTIGDRTQPTSATVNPSGFLINAPNGLTLNGSNLTVATSASLTSAGKTVMVKSLTVTGNSTITDWRTASTNSNSLVFTTDSTTADTTPLSIATGSMLTIAAGGNTGLSTPRVTLGTTTCSGSGGTVTFQTSASGGVSGSGTTATAVLATNLTLGAVTDNGNTTVFQGQGSATQLPGSGIFLNTASTFTGPWTIGNAAGTQGVAVSLGASGNSAASLTSGNITVNPFGALQFFTAAPATFGSASQTITLNGLGAQTSGGLGTPGALKYGITAGSSATFGGNVVIGTAAPTTIINVTTLNTLTLGGSFTVNGAMQFLGGGTLAMTQANAGAGNVTVSGGTLRAANSVGSATGTGAITVSGGGVLSNGTSASPSSGTYGSPVIIASGGVIAPGFGVGTLTHNTGTMTWQGGGTYNFEYNATTLSPVAGTTNDFINSGATLDLGSLSAASPFVINPIAVGYFPDGTQSVSYTLAQFSGSGVNSITGFDPTKFTVTGAFASNASVALTTTGGVSSLVLTFTPVPEPATALLLCAAGAGATAYVRRKRMAAGA